MNKQELAKSLERVVADDCGPHELQDIIDLGRAKDPQVRGVAYIVNWLSEVFPGEPGSFCNERGIQVMQLIAEELRSSGSSCHSGT